MQCDIHSNNFRNDPALKYPHVTLVDKVMTAQRIPTFMMSSKKKQAAGPLIAPFQHVVEIAVQSVGNLLSKYWVKKCFILHFLHL
jgi:hypothetical protein